MSQAVKVERHGAVAVLRLDDPKAMNALSPAVKAGMEANVPKLVGDAEVRAIVITGTGKAFCAGGDIRAMQEPDKLMSEALAAAEEIASGPAAMLTMSKVMMKRAYEASVEDFFEREAVAQAIAFGSAEFSEGVDAFLGKRKPRFNG